MRRSRSIVLASLSVVIALFAPLLAGCERADGSATSTVKLMAADSGKQVTLKRGQKLQVTLESNRTTGFGWEVRDDGGVLEADGESAYEAPDTTLVGAGGEETFTFTAVEAGRGSLLLEYRRPWEKDVPAEKTFELTVEVR